MDLVGETKTSFNVVKQTLYRQTIADSAQVPLDNVIIISITDIETRRRSVHKVSAYTGIRVETSIIAPDSSVADQVVERISESVDSGQMAQRAQASGIGAVMVGIGSAAVGGDSNRQVVRNLRTSKLVGTDGIERPRRLISARMILPPPGSSNLTSTDAVLPGAVGDENSPFAKAFVDLGKDKDAVGGVAIGVGCAAALILAIAAYFIRKKRLEAKLKAAAPIGKAADADTTATAKEHI